VTRASYQPDALDAAIMAALEGDIRKPAQSLSDIVGASAITIRRRIERLLEQGIISLAPLVDLYAAGYPNLLLIGIRVEHISPFDVAKEVAALSATLTVNVVMGHYDIELVAALPNRGAVSSFLTETLPRIQGIARVDPALALDVWKFRRGYRAHSAEDAPRDHRPLDTLDRRIITSLRQNARKSNRAVAAEIGASESAVRSRIKRMQQLRQISFEYLQRHPDGPMSAAFVGIDVQGGSGRSVCHALTRIPEVSFVATTLGRHDLICALNVTEVEQLTGLLHTKVVPIAGVKRTAPSHCLQQITHQSELGFIL
jgi:Lrp/AsnC family transcriptional regulator for asnA, asnC and gidA